MTAAFPSDATMRLVLRFILEEVEANKRSSYLQEIILMGRQNDIWMRALTAFFDAPMDDPSFRIFSKN